MNLYQPSFYTFSSRKQTKNIFSLAGIDESSARGRKRKHQDAQGDAAQGGQVEPPASTDSDVEMADVERLSQDGMYDITHSHKHALAHPLCKSSCDI